MSISLTPSASQLASLQEANRRYRDSMTPEVASWLDARGLDEEAVVTGSLGVVADPVLGHERFVGMVSIPYATKHVRPVGFKFRNLTDDGPKYDAPAGQPSRLYGVQTLTPAPAVLVCEGELDALLAHRVTGLPTVGVAGVSAWKRHHRRVLEGFPRVLVLADNDAGREPDEKGVVRNPGRELARKICESLPQAQAIDLPPGDVTDFVTSGGDLADLLGVGV